MVFSPRTVTSPTSRRPPSYLRKGKRHLYSCESLLWLEAEEALTQPVMYMALPPDSTRMRETLVGSTPLLTARHMI